MAASVLHVALRPQQLAPRPQQRSNPAPPGLRGVPGLSQGRRRKGGGGGGVQESIPLWRAGKLEGADAGEFKGGIALRVRGGVF